MRVAWAGEKRNRKLVRVKESKEKSLKRMAGEDSQDIANNREGKRRKIVSEIEITKERVKKRQSVETERHKAEFKSKKDRERRLRESVGIRGNKESEGMEISESDNESETGGPRGKISTQ